MVKCEVCGKEFLVIMFSHLKLHNLTMSEYKNMFPDVQIYGIPMRNKGTHLSELHLQHLRENHWARKPIEETQEIRKICSENGRRSYEKMNSEGGTAFRMPKGYHTQEFKDNMSIRLKEIERTPEWKENTRKSHWTHKSPEEVQEIVERIAQNGGISNTKHGWFHSNKMNEDFFFMSSYEEKRMNFLENHDDVVGYTNRHGILIDYCWNGENHRYIVDLKIIFKNGDIRLEEIKGQVDDRVLAKEKACIEYCKEHNLQYKMIFLKDLEVL